MGVGRLAAQHYLHIRSGGWQWRIEPDAIVELRHELTKETVAELSAVLVVHMLAHYLGQAQLTAALLPQLELPTAPIGPADVGRRGLRGVGRRRLRGYPAT